jgi:fermentation-respiration switch protein FrsA (DUF1100 family)
MRGVQPSIDRTESLMLKLAAAVAVLCTLIGAAAWLRQRQLIYFPATARIDPASLGLVGVAEQILETPDGNRLVCWWGRARPGARTILYFHGNGGNLADRAERVRTYQNNGIGIFMVSYRGYGGSTGSPTEAANVADAKLAYDWLVGSGVRADDVVLYGESLGSGVAVQLALDRPVAGLVLDAPYTSIVELGAQVYPFLPVRLLLWDRYETIRYIGRVRAPILVLHGERDQVVPVEMGRAVFAVAPDPKRIATFPGAQHSDHHLHGSYDVVLGWLRELRASSP